MAQPQNFGDGILGQFGLNFTEDDLRQANADKMQGRIDSAGDDYVRSDFRRQAAQAGAGFAAILGQKNYHPNEEQYHRINTAKAAQTRLQTYMADNPKATSQDKTDAYQQYLAEEAFRNGLPEVGSGILTKMDTERTARSRQQAELKKLDLGNELDEATLEDAKVKSHIEAGKAGYITQAYLVGSRDPNSAVSGIYDPRDSSLQTAKGKIPMGEWTTVRPEYDPARTALAAGGGVKTKIGTTEQEKQRDRIGSAQDLIDRTIDIDKVLNSVYERGGNTPGAMGMTGKLVSFANRFVNTAVDLAKAISPDEKTVGKMTLRTSGTFGTKEVDLDNANDRHAFAEKNAARIAGYLPQGFAKSAEEADRMAAMIVDLAYAKARSNEPGAKALTDADFNEAMVSIGGKLNDPTTLRKILFQNAYNSTRSLKNRWRYYNEDDLDSIIDKSGRQHLEESLHELDGRMGFDTSTGVEYGADYPKGDRRGDPNLPYGQPPAGGGPPPGLSLDAFKAWRQAHPDWQPQRPMSGP